MRTLGHAQDLKADLYVGCRCGWSASTPARSQCRALRAFTVEELQRLGWFRCEACGKPAAVSIYAEGFLNVQLECWNGDYGFRRDSKFEDSMGVSVRAWKGDQRALCGQA